MKKLIRDYLSFTRKERIGITVIVILISIILFFPFLRGFRSSRTNTNTDSLWVSAMKKLKVKNPDFQEDDQEIKKPYRKDHKTDYDEQNASGSLQTLFSFDPNKISVEGWKQLGVREKTIATIKNYLSKGGAFRKAEDLQKVYGLDKREYERLEPYVKIEKVSANNSAKEFASEKRTFENYAARPYYKDIDINTVDTTGFIALPGIGSKLALRIIAFREKLGGFYSIDQVKETYGVADSVFQKVKQYFKCESNSVKKINLNSATKEELKAHPYIRWNIANAIAEFRNQHGLFIAIEDLKKIQAINEETFNKLKPYLTL